MSKKFYEVELRDPDHLKDRPIVRELWAKSKKQAARIARRDQRHEYGRHLVATVYREEK